MKRIIRRWLGLDGELAIDAVRGEIASFELGPNDILVLMTDQVVSAEAATRLRDHLEDAIRSDRKALVLTSGLRLNVIRRSA